MAKRRKTDNTMAKRRKTDNTMAKRRKTDNTMATRKRTKGQTTIYKTFNLIPTMRNGRSLVVCDE